MFEKIPFHTHTGDFASAEVYRNDRYKRLIQEYDLPGSDHQEYQLDGTSQFILSHPMPKDRKDHFLYLRSFSYMSCGKRYFTRREYDDSYLLLITYEGNGMLTYEGKTYHLRSGDGFLIDCRNAHEYKTLGNFWIHGDLHLAGGNLDYLYETYFRKSTPLFQPASFVSFQNTLEQVLLMHISGSQKNEWELSELLNRLLIMANESLTGNKLKSIPEGVILARRYIDQRFLEDISIEMLSDIAHLSQYHLIRLFKKYTGFAPHEYIIRSRLSQAETMLKTTDLPSYKIGMLTGFPSEANFIRSFKLTYGLTPGQYRKS